MVCAVLYLYESTEKGAQNMLHYENWEAFMKPVLHEKLLVTLISDFEKDLYENGCGHVWRQEKEAEEILSACLDATQKKSIHAMVLHFGNCIRYALPFGFSRGIYAAFESDFDTCNKDHFFSLYVSNVICRLPAMREHAVYYHAYSCALQIYEVMSKQLEEDCADHLLSLG